MKSKTSNRLPEYDYSQPGGYFITLITQKRQPLFGEVEGETMKLSPVGEIVRSEWLRTDELRPDITLDEYVIMPNHFHAVLFINGQFQFENELAAHRSAQLRNEPLRREPRSLGAIVAGFKSAASRGANQSLWQRNYYDRIIRNEEELNRIRNYIIYNPTLLSQPTKAW